MTTRTIPDAILHAAEGRTSTLEDLAVRLWESDRRRFGMADYEDLHPDTRRIAAAVMGKRGLVGRGCLSQSGRLYSLTDAGRTRLHGTGSPMKASAAENGRKPAKAAPDAGDAELRRLLHTEVWRLRRKEDRPVTTFAHAVAWWDAEEGDVDASLTATTTFLATLEPRTLSDGRVFSAADAADMRALDGWLRTRFDRHLNVARHRARAAGC